MSQILKLTIFGFMLFVLAACQSPVEDLFADIEQNKDLMSLADSCPFENFKEPEIAFDNHIETCKFQKQSCLDKCFSGSANYCFAVAHVIDAEKSEPKYAEVLYARSCELGLVLGCTNHGANFAFYKPSEFACYIPEFKFACERNDSWGCVMYGRMMAEGRGTDQDYIKAKDAFNKTCIVGPDDDACVFAKELLEKILNLEK